MDAISASKVSCSRSVINDDSNNNNNNGNNDHDDDDDNEEGNEELSNDAEGVWSVDIEQSFQEALSIYPPCGRRKIILSDEGKMYGRNELIARYIKLRTGKHRSRKQVSSHIQVMARRKSKEIQAQLKDQASKDRALQALSTLSSAQIVSPVHGGDNRHHGLHAPIFYPNMSHLRPSAGFRYNPYGSSAMQQLWGSGAVAQDIKLPYSGQMYGVEKPLLLASELHQPWQGRSIAGPQLRLVEFTAFLEHGHSGSEPYSTHLFVHIGRSVSYSDPLLEAVDIRQISDKFPEKRGGFRDLFDKGPQSSFFLVKFWADLNVNLQNITGRFYGVSMLFESQVEMIIQCSTKVCSFGKQVVEKVETEFARCENGRYFYPMRHSPMCEYMVNFIHKLKQLPEKYMMNSVLENFTILQLVVNKETQATLLCIAYVFEVSTREHGSQHHIYRLV